MAGPQINNLHLVEDVAPFLTRRIEASDEIQTDSEWTFGADVVINANLSVNGTLTAVDSQNTLFTDNNLYLNNGYTTASARTGGLTVNYLPTATNDTVAATGFVAGVAAVSNPTVITTGTGTFSAGDFIQISGANDPANNGLFEVLSHVGTTLTIRGIGTTATVEDFTQNQFVTDTTVAGTITVVNVSVLRAGTDGLWEQAQGASTGLVFTDLGSGTGNSLQAAYVVGNQITTSGAEGDVIIAGTEQLLITATGGIDIDTVLDFDGTSFDVQMTGTNGFSIDGTAASNVTVDQGNLSLGTTTSGDVDILAAGDVDIDGTNVEIDATAGFSIDGAAASNVTATGANLTLSTATSGDVDILAAGDVDIDGTNLELDATAGVSIDAAAASNFTVDGAALTLSTTTSGDVDITAAGKVDLSSGAAETAPGLTIEQTGTNGDLINVHVGQSDPSAGGGVAAPVGSLFARDTGGAGTAGQLWLKTGAANTAWSQVSDASSITLQNAYVGGNTIVTSAPEGPFDVSGTEAISLDASAASNFTVAGANLTLATTTSGDVDISAAGNVDVDGTAIELDATAGVSIDAAAASNFSVAGANLTLETTTSGSLDISSAGDSTYTVPNNSTAAWTLTDGTDVIALANTTPGEEQFEVPSMLEISGGAGVELTTDAALTAGDIVTINASGNVELADATSGTFRLSLVSGVSRGSYGAATTASLYTVPGSIIPVRFTAAPAASENGRPVFLSSTTGQASLTPPTGSPHTRFVIGQLQGADGVSTTPDVLYLPQYISRRP